MSEPSQRAVPDGMPARPTGLRVNLRHLRTAGARSGGVRHGPPARAKFIHAAHPDLSGEDLICREHPADYRTRLEIMQDMASARR